MSWFSKILGSMEGSPFKEHRFSRGADIVVFDGQEQRGYKFSDGFDEMYYQTPYLRPDGTYTVRFYDTMGRQNFSHGLSVEDIRRTLPKLAREMGLTREIRV